MKEQATATKVAITKELNTVKRNGIENVKIYLEASDFFVAPASTRFHEAYEGGLAEHSLEVLKAARKLNALLKEPYKDEQLIICSLLHDLCKCNFYGTELRNAKNAQTGAWEKVPYYTVKEEFGYGHGEKSVYVIEHHAAKSLDFLSQEEASAIRWHMGGWDEGRTQGEGLAYETYPLALVIHQADMLATYAKGKLA